MTTEQAEQALQEAFKKEWGNPPFNEKEATHLAMRHMFRAGFTAGLSSKVKPVNESKAIEAIRHAMFIKDLWSADQHGTVSADHEGEMQALKGMEQMFKEALSTAPDDKFNL